MVKAMWRPRSGMAAVLGALGIALCLGGEASAQPVQGAQDQACRDEATRRVMGEQSAVDPYVRGRQYWNACMARSGGGKSKATAARRGGGKAKARRARR